ncbi:ribosomal protein L7/L12 [Streptomyces sp. NPDC003710]
MIRAIRSVTGLSLWNSKLLRDTAPVAVTEPDWLEVAHNAAAVLEAAGAHATVLCDWCERTITREASPIDPAPCSGPWPPDLPGKLPTSNGLSTATADELTARSERHALDERVRCQRLRSAC